MIYHYFSSIERVYSVLEDGHLWFSSLQKLNDPFERLFPFWWVTEDGRHKKRLKDPVSVIQGNLPIGIFCLTSMRDDFRMWSHYANCHQGVVVGFNFDKGFSSEESWEVHKNSDGTKIYKFPIVYSAKNDKVLNIRSINNFSLSDVLFSVSRKFRCWKSEKETRLAVIGTSDEGVPIERDWVKEIIFGAAISFEEREVMAKRCKLAAEKVQFFFALLDISKGRLAIERMRFS